MLENYSLDKSILITLFILNVLAYICVKYISIQSQSCLDKAAKTCQKAREYNDMGERFFKKATLRLDEANDMLKRTSTNLDNAKDHLQEAKNIIVGEVPKEGKDHE